MALQALALADGRDAREGRDLDGPRHPMHSCSPYLERAVRGLNNSFSFTCSVGIVLTEVSLTNAICQSQASATQWRPHFTIIRRLSTRALHGFWDCGHVLGA